MAGMAAEARGAPAQCGPRAAGGPTQTTHLADDGDAREVTIGLLANERKLLAEIDEALARIDSGTYGVCLATGRRIGKPRLRARRWAKYCIEYARAMEKRSPAGSRTARFRAEARRERVRTDESYDEDLADDDLTD
jgi:RNA polymerase-binding transcription factor DksA